MTAIAALLPSVPMSPVAMPPLAMQRADLRTRVVLLVREPLRRRQLERSLDVTAEAEADAMVVDLCAGESLPAEAGAFDGPLVVLSDDPAVAADTALAAVLPRHAGDRQIAAAAAAVVEGLTVRTPVIPDPVGFAVAEPKPRPLLTPREMEILAQVGQGMSNKAIARRLGISAHTVKYHLEAVFLKLGVRSRAEAVTRGLRHGLLVV